MCPRWYPDRDFQQSVLVLEGIANKEILRLLETSTGVSAVRQKTNRVQVVCSHARKMQRGGSDTLTAATRPHTFNIFKCATYSALPNLIVPLFILFVSSQDTWISLIEKYTKPSFPAQATGDREG